LQKLSVKKNRPGINAKSEASFCFVVLIPGERDMPMPRETGQGVAVQAADRAWRIRTPQERVR
jgi:hypothetical protein